MGCHPAWALRSHVAGRFHRPVPEHGQGFCPWPVHWQEHCASEKKKNALSVASGSNEEGTRGVRAMAIQRDDSVQLGLLA